MEKESPQYPASLYSAPLDSEQVDSEQGVLLLACGALAKDIISLIERNNLRNIYVKCLPAKLHHTPAAIPEAIRAKIRENKEQYKKIFVVYGDCGTAGALDKVLEEEGGIERIPGPHCFSFYWGNEDFAQDSADEIANFYLTDFFCRFFETFIWEALGLDRHESMVEFVFGNYKKLVYIPQEEDESLELKAQQIAKKLGLDFECRPHSFGDLQMSILSLDAKNKDAKNNVGDVARRTTHYG